MDQKSFTRLTLTPDYRTTSEIQRTQGLLEEVLPTIPDAELLYGVFYNENTEYCSFEQSRICFRRNGIRRQQGIIPAKAVSKSAKAMKKTLLAILILFSAFYASAQDRGSWGIGPKINLYTHTGRGAVFGIGGYFRYSLTDALRLEMGIVIPCKSECSVDIGCDAHYLFHITEQWSLFPTVGVNVNDLGKWSCGFDVGGGCDYRISRRWSTSLMLKYRFQTAMFARNPILISLGGTFTF
jgi:hypothetical protein